MRRPPRNNTPTLLRAAGCQNIQACRASVYQAELHNALMWRTTRSIRKWGVEVFSTEPPSVVEHGERDLLLQRVQVLDQGSTWTQREANDTSSILTASAGVSSKSSWQSSFPFVIKPPTQEGFLLLFCFLPHTARSLISSKFKEISCSCAFFAAFKADLCGIEKSTPWPLLLQNPQAWGVSVIYFILHGVGIIYLPLKLKRLKERSDLVLKYIITPSDHMTLQIFSMFFFS